jgi:hypothetical protein
MLILASFTPQIKHSMTWMFLPRLNPFLFKYQECSDNRPQAWLVATSIILYKSIYSFRPTASILSLTTNISKRSQTNESVSKYPRIFDTSVRQGGEISQNMKPHKSCSEEAQHLLRAKKKILHWEENLKEIYWLNILMCLSQTTNKIHNSQWCWQSWSRTGSIAMKSNPCISPFTHCLHYSNKPRSNIHPHPLSSYIKAHWGSLLTCLRHPSQDPSLFHITTASCYSNQRQCSDSNGFSGPRQGIPFSFYAEES